MKCMFMPIVGLERHQNSLVKKILKILSTNIYISSYHYWPIGSEWWDCHVIKKFGWQMVDGEYAVIKKSGLGPGWQGWLAISILSSWRKIRLGGHLGWGSCVTSTGKWRRVLARGAPDKGWTLFPCSGFYSCLPWQAVKGLLHKIEFKKLMQEVLTT